MVTAFATGTSGDDGSLGPEIDEGIDVLEERVGFGGDADEVVEGDVRVDRAHEQEGGGAGVKVPDAAGVHGPAEVVGDEGDTLTRGAVRVVAVEREDELLGPGLHEDGHGLADDALAEGDEAAGQRAEHIARIFLGGVDVLQLEDEARRRGHARLHGGGEEGLLAVEVAEDGGGRDPELAGDVGQRGAVEALFAEDAAGRLEEGVAGDACGSSYL
jgi:hypothetical protein